MIRVFIVDDHPLVVEGIKSMLQQLPEIELVGHAGNASSALSFFSQHATDVVLLDISLPDQSGLDLCRKLTDRNPGLRIIALTNFDQLTYIQGMKNNGARGFLLKNSSSGEIQAALHTVMEGGECWLGKANVQESLSDQQLLLTRREVEVLRLITEGLTNHQIAEKLFVSDSTVDSHRKNLIAKLKVKNTAALVRLAIENKII